jgi:hypothetical protein
VQPRLLPALLLTAACRPGAAGPSSKPSAAPEQAPTRAATTATAPASAVHFEPRPGPVLRAEETASTLPRLSFTKPSADELLEPASIANASVEVDAELSRLGPHAGIEVSLDGLRPRRIQVRSIALSSVIPVDTELAAGEHHLVAAAADADGRLIRTHAGRPLSASVRFWLGSRRAGGPAPQIVCWGPNGTYYGDSAEPALDILLDPRSEARTSVVVASVSADRALASTRIDASQPWGILGLMSGDYRVVVELEKQGGGGPRDDCSFTLNREREGAGK